MNAIYFLSLIARETQITSCITLVSRIMKHVVSGCILFFSALTTRTRTKYKIQVQGTIIYSRNIDDLQ